MGKGKGSGGENYINPVYKYLLFFSHVVFWVSSLVSRVSLIAGWVGSVPLCQWLAASQARARPRESLAEIWADSNQGGIRSVCQPPN